jgi:hypothetical protein
MSFRGRLGVFFLIIGLVSMVLFVASLVAGGLLVLPMLLGVFSLIAGLTLILRSRPPPAGERFRTIRTVQQKMADRGSKRKK